MKIQNSKNILGATKLFELLLKKNKLERHHMVGEDKSMILPFFNSWDGILPIWMIKSDELCVHLTGKRLWDVTYEGSQESVCGLVCKDKVEDIESYNQYPVATDKDVPAGLRFFLCQHAFVENMIFSGVTFDYRDLTGLYNIKGPLENGETLPFPSEDSITMLRLNQFIIETNPKKSMDLELKNAGVEL